MLALANPIFAQGLAMLTAMQIAVWPRLTLRWVLLPVFAGLGQGRATASAAEAMARNPGAIAAIRVALILGLVLIESLALYTLVITFIAR